MDCPFDLGFDDQMDAEDPHVDVDEKHMHRMKPAEENPFHGFSVDTKQPHKSNFENEQRDKKLNAEKEAHRKAMTIDDDEPDFEPED